MALDIQDFCTSEYGIMPRTKIISAWVEWPTIWVSSWIHGNEYFWVQVTTDFLERIQREEIQLLRWRLLLITAGNIEALLQNKRFLQDDLNRVVDKVPQEAVRDNYEQKRGAEIKRLIDWWKPKAWLDLHSFSAPTGLPYSFSWLKWYHALGSELGIQNMAVNMENANKKAAWGKLECMGVADYVNKEAYWFTFEAGNHTDPQCLINTYQALINFLVTQEMIQGQKIEIDAQWNIHMIPHNDIVKIGGTESQHVHIEEKHIFTGWFRYAGEHPASFRKYTSWELIGYDIITYNEIKETEVEVRAPYDGYIIMPKDPKICIEWKEVFYFGKNMSEV